MAGQFTFTNGPPFHGERPWIIRAIMSLPVPLSPLISTGTLALATLSMRVRRACITSDLRNTIASGGNSPKGWTRELTEFVIGIGVFLRAAPLTSHQCAPREPN